MIPFFQILAELLGPQYFSKPSMQAPAPPPVDDSAAKAQAQADAARAAIAERNGAGRASTIVAGASLAADQQYGVGLLAQKRKAASQDLTLG